MHVGDDPALEVLAPRGRSFKTTLTPSTSASRGGNPLRCLRVRKSGRIPRPNATGAGDVGPGNVLIRVVIATATSERGNLANLYLLVEVFALLYLPARWAIGHLGWHRDPTRSVPATSPSGSPRRYPGGLLASVGVATWDRVETAWELLRRADHVMYHARWARRLDKDPDRRAEDRSARPG